MDILKNPLVAAIVAAIITALYLYGKNKLNQEETKFMKPAVLNGILVYGIVYVGTMSRPKSLIPY